MGVDEHRQHAFGFVGLDEAHAAHVGRKVEDEIDPLHDRFARFAALEIDVQVLSRRVELMPLVERLGIDRPDASVAELPQSPHQVPADEASGTGDENPVLRTHDLLHSSAASLSGRLRLLDDRFELVADASDVERSLGVGAAVGSHFGPSARIGSQLAGRRQPSVAIAWLDYHRSPGFAQDAGSEAAARD